MKKKVKHSLEIFNKELKKEKRDNAVYYFLFSLSLISLFLFLFIISLHILEWTGYSTALTSKAGYITEVNITSSIPVNIWGGVYGLVLRVPDFTQQISESVDSGGIERVDIFFDCIQYDAQGGPEVYASTNSSLTISAATVSPATPEMVDQFINCSNEVFCANNTFTRNMSIFIGSTEITGIPSTYTYKFNGENEIFDIGILNISGQLAFVSHINESIHQGFNPDVLVNYQMLLPTPANTTQTYYFYADPNDECPSGGIGNSINATIYGYVSDGSGNSVENATITVAGYSALSDSSGFYNLSTLVLEGTYNIIAQKLGFDPSIGNVSVNFSSYVIQKNMTLKAETPAQESETLTPLVFGKVTDTSGSALSGVNVSLGNSTVVTNTSGEYSFRPLVSVGTYPIIAIKQNYDNYYANLNFTLSTSSVNHNITMSPSNLNNYPTGPYTQYGLDDQEGDNTKKAKEEAQNLGQDFWISTSEINKQVRENTFVDEEISIYNFRNTAMQVLFSISSDIDEIVKMDKTALTISPDSFESVVLTISGTKPIGVYRGKITLSGDLESEIPVKIEIVPKKLPVETLIMEIDLLKDIVNVGGKLRYRVNLQNLLTEQGYRVGLNYLILDSNDSEIYVDEKEEVEIRNSLTLIKEIDLPSNISEGEYLLRVEANYLNLFSSATSPFIISQPIYLYAFFGIPLWAIFIFISFCSFILLNFFLYMRHVQKKKRYHLALKLETLPKPGERSIKIGKIAETNIPAYYNLDDLTTHAIVAGATGGGKSIAAQVFVEEALEKGIAVIVFDPTAQWSGMLRKCEDKKMLSFYPKFGLKPNDAKAFPGSVRQIQNERQVIDIKKHMTPGHIQIFTLNKLTPTQIDTFSAGVIASIFKSDPKEHPELKVLLVFDEVHRLLPKFGGSGKGFLQIERACREFRKWGIGVMLVSQVLSDFVGEIKANINTEIQMRTRDEADLNRLKTKYGEEFLQSLIKASVGVGMFVNPKYNKGKPYFINFRPILHNTRRLPDSVLEQYNKYGDTIEDIEYQIEQLEGEKVDTFDLKMELKLVKDKLMTGNFTVVDIYLEGLKPRLEKQWEALGKKPKKKQIELIEEKELESSIAAAEKEREKWNEKAKKEEKKEEKPETAEDIAKKIVSPLTFDNGIMVSSLKELKDVLPSLDDEVFKIHVNEEKNDISEWVAKEIDSGLGERLKGKDKAGMLKEIEGFGRERDEEEKVEKEEVKKDSNEKGNDSDKKEEKAESNKGEEEKN